MLIKERDNRTERVIQAAQQMATAARTAPKGKGVDIIEIAIATADTIQELSEEMRRICEETGMMFLLRDSENILKADAILLIATKPHLHGLNCGYCGFATCEDKIKTVPCAITSTDVGIAIGSACATAMDLRIDTRVMFTIGTAALRLGLLPECGNCYGIALSCSSKNPFFDRQSTKPKE
ncbi:MAG: ferredoxin domain-containing protein [Phocaeicola sp.]